MGRLLGALAISMPLLFGGGLYGLGVLQEEAAAQQRATALREVAADLGRSITKAERYPDPPRTSMSRD